MPRIRIAACAFQRRKGRIEVMVVTSRSQGRWILPRGRREAGHSNRAVAAMEAYEEAGVLARPLDRKPVHIRLEQRGKITELALYALRTVQILDRWPERLERRRRLVPLEALERVLSDQALARAARRLLS